MSEFDHSGKAFEVQEHANSANGTGSANNTGRRFGV